MTLDNDFSGAKIALLCGTELVTYLRDDMASIPFPACWDLAGGGREANETPEHCALRETHEEFGISVDPQSIIWKRKYTSDIAPGARTYFLVAHITRHQVSQIEFGNEGQYWKMMNVQDFLDHPNAIPHLQSRLATYLQHQPHA